MELRFITPEDVLTGLKQLDGHIESSNGFLINAREKNIVTNNEEQELLRLKFELNLLSDILSSKLSDFIKLRYEILFKFYPKLVRDYDKQQYLSLEKEIPIAIVADEDEKDFENKENAFFKTHFKIINDVNFDKVYELLVKHQFLKQSDKDAFFKFCKLEPINKSQKIIWLEKFRNGPSIRTLLKVVINLVLSLHSKKHVKKYYGRLTKYYFTCQEGILKENSLEVVASALINEENNIPANSREEIIDDIFLKAFVNSA